MSVGQAVLSRGLDIPAVTVVANRLERRRVDAGRLHAGMLRDVLELHTLHAAAGMALMTQSDVAQLLGVSEWRAGKLLHEALGLGELAGAFEALEWGVFHPDQCSTVVDQLAPLTPPQRAQVWQRLMARLGADAQAGVVLPRARLEMLLKRWVQQIAPQDAVDRRKAAEDHRRVEYRRRDDGLADIFLIGLRATDAQAVLQRIRDASAPVTSWEDRLADQRRLDAAVDLLLGRNPLGTGHGSGCAAGCGCLPGQAAPCGTNVNVHVTLNGALGTTDEPATLERHGPIEPDLLQELLLNAPVLRAVFVNERGIPNGMSRKRLRPERGDPESVRHALLRVGNLKPDKIFPVHPDDHPPPSTSHPPDPPGPYLVTGLLRDLIFARSPRCEWPGCGMPASACDAEHDRAWPDGPTCSCDLGPCCRHHHRVKQLGFTKTRRADGSLTWTHPVGRQRRVRSQHEPPQAPVRDLAPLTQPTQWEQLSPDELDEVRWILDGRPEDPAVYELRAEDVEPEDSPVERTTTWSWDLDDPYPWLPPFVVGS